MKIVSWNCNGAFRRKYDYLSRFEADIYVIQECENPSERGDKLYENWASSFLWIGANKHKGLGIFARGDIKLELLNWPDQFRDKQVRYFLPCRVNDAFTLVGVWAHFNQSTYFGYIGQFWKYLQLNRDNLASAIIAGDFNSNAKWHSSEIWWNHSDVVSELEDLGIRSLYHQHFNEMHGAESIPTFFLQKNIEKPYHIDFVFAAESTISTQRFSMEIGGAEDWLTLSDHLPVVLSFS